MFNEFEHMLRILTYLAVIALTVGYLLHLSGAV